MLLSLSLLLSCFSLAIAAEPIDTITSRLAQPDALRGEFIQKKQLAGFRNPLRSNGTFLLVRERGIVWQTLAPFPSEMVVTAERIVSRQADGSTHVEVDAAQQPALGTVNRLLFALFSGDVALLSERFDIQANVIDAQRWSLALKPRPGALADVFKRIELHGDTHVREVTIEERAGDVSEITFDALRDTPAALTPDEARLFD